MKKIIKTGFFEKNLILVVSLKNIEFIDVKY